jgi:hyperosmotically inducible periplasmic protein
VNPAANKGENQMNRSSMKMKMQMQMKMHRSSIAVFALAIAFTCLPAIGQDAPANADIQSRGMGQPGIQRLVKEVRHELVLLPYYGVFDNLAYKVDSNGTVTLMGQVTRPTLKSDSEAAVKHIEGVEQVINQIEVLPLSPNDDGIRRGVYRALYGNSVLSQYALQAVPPIHIIVKNGNITLIGVVDSDMDKTIAGTQANTVPGAFSVTNNLVVDKGK